MGMISDQPMIRSLVRNLPLPALLCTPLGEVIESNDSWNRLTSFRAEDGYTIDSLAARAISEEGNPSARLDFKEHLLSPENHHTTRTFEITTARGKSLTLAFTSSIILDFGTDQSWTLIQAVDISERIQFCEDFIGIVSHDLKSPLVAIRLNSELIKRAIDSKKSAVFLKKIATRIDRVTHQMNRLIDDLLDMSRIQSGALLIDFAPISVRELLDQSMDMLRPIALDKSLKIDMTCQPELVAFCHRDKLIQVISNLIGNAIKFSPSGSTILCQATEVKDDILFSVTDQGGGIPEDHLSKVFDRYWQAPNTKRQGSGLGLYIAKSIVEAHGGRIWAESRLHKGTTFVFTLPRSQKDSGPASSPHVLDVRE